MIAPAFPTETGIVNGGTAGVSYYLAKALQSSGKVELTVLRPTLTTLTPAGSREIDGISLRVIPRLRIQQKHYYLLRGVHQQLQSVISELEPDVLHSQGDPSFSRLWPRSVCTIHGIAELDVLFRGARWSRWLRYLLIKGITRRARHAAPHVISISPYVRKFIGVNPNQKVWDIPNPVAESFFDIDHKPVLGRIFSASHCTRLKNIELLIRAFSLIYRKHPNAELRLAGSDQDSAYGQECRSLANELSVAAKVKFLGLLPVAKLQEELSRASVFALCSLQENAPLSISEAQSAGVPVVASRIGGIPWMVEDGVTGFLADPASVEDVAQKLEIILSNPSSAEMGVAARRKAECSYHPEFVADKTLTVYDEILSLKESRQGV